MGKCGSLSLNSSRVRVGWLLSLLACRSLSRDRLQLCLVNGNSTQPSVELSGKCKCVSGKSFSSTLLTFGYFRSLLQVGGEIFRELGLLGLYVGDSHFRGPLWLRKPCSL